MTKNKHFIIDFDSTFIQVEALEELARISLRNNPDKKNILKEIKRITDMGIEMKMSFSESLSKRIRLLNANRSHIELLHKRLKNKVSVSISRNKEFFRNFREHIYIVSGGFKEIILPITREYELPDANVFANTFLFDEEDNIVGFDENNVMAQADGKTRLLKQLNFSGDIYVIGDGYTDYQIREAGLANKFYAFTENIERTSILDKADHIAPSFDEFLFLNKLPMAISYPKNRINVLLLENIHQAAIERFKQEGYNIVTLPSGLEGEELIKRIEHVSVLGIRSKTHISEEILKHANRLISIGVFCIGTDQITLPECSKKGIAVFNAPFSNTRSVVELALGEIIMLMRNVFEKSTNLHRGHWDKSSLGNHEIRGKRLGIVGYGKIGSQLSVLAESIGMEVYYYDIFEKLAMGNAKKCNSLPELLKKVDVISVHVDGRESNRHLFSDPYFRAMKHGTIFINLSRGSVVDTSALVKYIKNGKIKGAAIDVFEEEPVSNQGDFSSDLQNLPNVILTPHVGGSTVEAQKNIAEFVSHKIIEYINTGDSIFSVNFPNLQLPEFTDSHRLIHIHENIPGMLAQINGVLAHYDININGQYLQTNKEIGYVITDISKTWDSSLIRDLKKIPGTIKFRILY
ncbi:phosphoglycerate dehydrogenase [candidate division KSB1 bacterium]|nr:phosphoglycerate dehydrogenase [candidate division KSB1 bacterium]